MLPELVMRSHPEHAAPDAVVGRIRTMMVASPVPATTASRR